MGNDAIQQNPNIVNGKSVAIAITTHGSDFYFAICAVMLATTLGIVASSYFKPRSDRVFFYITAGVTGTATIAYFTMGSNLGWVPIDVEYFRENRLVHGRNREIFYARYVDWQVFVTTPLLIMDLMLTAGMPWPTIAWTIFLDWVMIVTGLVGALVKSRYKWGFFTFGCAAMLYVFYNIGWEGRKHAKVLGADVHRVYLLCGVWTLFLWTLYPVAWGLCEGGNIISPDSEAVFYGILDFCAKPVFSVMLLIGHWNIDPARMGLAMRDYSDPVTGPTKNYASTGNGAGNGIGNGTGNGTGNGEVATAVASGADTRT